MYRGLHDTGPWGMTPAKASAEPGAAGAPIQRLLA